jgi:hypothetical protein
LFKSTKVASTAGNYLEAMKAAWDGGEGNKKDPIQGISKG